MLDNLPAEVLKASSLIFKILAASKSSLKFFAVLFAKSPLKNLPKIFFFYIYVLLKIQFEKLK